MACGLTHTLKERQPPLSRWRIQFSPAGTIDYCPTPGGNAQRYRRGLCWIGCTIMVLIGCCRITTGAETYQPRLANPLNEPWRWHSFSELKGRGLRCLAEGFNKEMWFGVEQGAMRYDGLNWTEFGEDAGLPSAVEAFATVDDRLFAATRFGIYELDVAPGAAETWKPFLPASEERPWQYWDLIATKKSDLWAATTWGLLKLPTAKTKESSGIATTPTLFSTTQIAAAFKQREPALRIQTQTIDAVTWHTASTGYGLSIFSSSPGGSSVVALSEGGPAQRAGLQIGDRILSVGGEPRSTIRQGELAPAGGTAIALSISRQGVKQPFIVEMTSESSPAKWQRFRPTAIAEDSSGAVWVGTVSGSLYSLQQEPSQPEQFVWTNHTATHDLPRMRAPDIARTSRGVAVVSRDLAVHQMLEYDGSDWKSTPLKGWVNQSVVESTQAGILIGAAGAILSINNGRETRYPTGAYGIHGNNLLVCQAVDESIWVAGLDSIALRIEPQGYRWKTYDELNYQGSTTDGADWFLSKQLKVIQHSGNRWQAYDASDGLMSVPLSVVTTKSGEVWAAGSHEGVAATAKFDGEKWERKLHHQLSWSVDRRAVFEDRDGRMWFGAASGYPPNEGFEGGIVRFDGTDWKHIVSAGSFPYVHRFCQTADGSIWTRGPRLAQILPDDSVADLSGLPERVRGYSVAIGNDSNGDLWVSRNRYGLAHLKSPWLYTAGAKRSQTVTGGGSPNAGPTTVWYTELDGLSNNRLRNILPMPDGSLLTSSYAGFDRFKDGTWCSSPLPDQEAGSVSNGALRSDGRDAVWVNLSRLSAITHQQAITGKPTQKPRSEFRTIRYTPNNQAPETQISTSSVRFREATGASISFHGRDRWNTTATSKLMYSWSVDEGPWSAFSYDTLADITDLAAGKHEFQVRARDSDLNVDTSPAVLTFEITPPIWRRAWFLSLMVLTAALIAVAFFQSVRVVRQGAYLKTTNEKLVLAEGHLQRSNVELERRVYARTAELRAVNARLLQEIGEREAVQQRLNESELQYRSIIEDQTEKVIRFKKDGTLTFANSAYQKNNGLTPETVTGFNCFSVIHPDDRDRMIKMVRATSIAEPFVIVMRVMRPNGAIDWTEWRGRALIDSSGTHYGYQAVGRIVTDLFEAEQKLRESELRYRSIVEDQHEMIIRFDQTGTITFANDAYARDAGCSPQEAIGRSCFDRIHPDDLQEARKLMAATNLENPSAFMQMRIVLDDGTIRWRKWNGRALYDDQQQLLGYQAIGRDITELRKAEARLRQKETELAHMARVSAMGEMVAGISHEIKQPLATISNFASASQMVLEQEGLSDEDCSKLQSWTMRISKQTDRINAIIQRLRRFGRPGSQKQTFSMRDAIKEALMVTETATRDAVDELKVDYSDELSEVHADRIQIEQVLVNLIRNACDAMVDTPIGERKLTIKATQDEQKLTVLVSDSGPGIPTGKTKEVFDMFITSKSDGMGMGLAISRSIIEAHDGKIRCVDGACGGQFEFSLPIGEHSSNDK